MAKKTVEWKLKYDNEAVIDTRTQDGKDMLHILQTMNNADDDAKRVFYIHMKEYISTLPKQKQDKISRVEQKGFQNEPKGLNTINAFISL